MSRRNVKDTRNNNNRIIAGLLAFIGGTFGVHRFYLGDIGGGIFYIFLFFVTMKFFPVTLILGIIEAMRLFKMDPEAFDEKYNSGVQGKSRRFQGRNKPQYRREGPIERKVNRNQTRSNGSRRKDTYTRRKQSIPKRNPFKTSGMQKYKDFDLDDAVVDFNKALKIAEKDPDIHFYLAAVYSLTEQKEKAYKHLSLAVEYGLKEPGKIETFEDLAFVRIQDDYETFKNNGYKMTSAPKAPAKPSKPADSKVSETLQEDVLDDDILLSQLNKLDELRKRGLISNEEFKIEKEKLIDHRK